MSKIDYYSHHEYREILGKPDLLKNDEGIKRQNNNLYYQFDFSQ